MVGSDCFRFADKNEAAGAVSDNRSYIPLACDDTFPRAVSADAPASSSRMPRLEIVITCLPGPPSCAPRRCVPDDSSHTSCLS